MKKLTTYQMVVTGLFSALMCIFGPISIPIGPIPVSLTMFVIYLAVFLLGTKLGTLSYIIYLLLGAVGLPVFSGYTGGMGKLLGPTGGYLIGFIPLAIICGFSVSKWFNNKILLALGMIVAITVAYVFGTIWFVYQMKCEVMYALSVCVFPFLIADFVKIVLAIILGSIIRKRLMALGYIKKCKLLQL